MWLLPGDVSPNRTSGSLPVRSFTPWTVSRSTQQLRPQQSCQHLVLKLYYIIIFASFFFFSTFLFVMIMTENRSILMKRRQLFYLILITGFSSFTVGSSEFHFINESKTYKAAKSYCNDNYKDLAKVHGLAHMKKLTTSLSKVAKGAWIGLEDKFAALDRGNYGRACGKWKGFVFRGNCDPTESRSRRGTQVHCSKLSLLNTTSENQNEAMSQTVWIGDIKHPCGKCDSGSGQVPECSSAILRYDGHVNDSECNNKFKFICQGATADNTEVVHSTSSTEVNNPTHEPVTTTTQSTTQLSTLTSRGNNQSVPPGNLILIQQNLTWIDAMTYCREHHNNLVQVTTREIQEEAAEKATNATSLHVWLGLRYTCKLNFWFWTRSTSACYLNWAEGEGPNGTYDCGFTGAIKATGGQWVGLPETDRLNFICSVCAG